MDSPTIKILKLLPIEWSKSFMVALPTTVALDNQPNASKAFLSHHEDRQLWNNIIWLYQNCVSLQDACFWGNHCIHGNSSLCLFRSTACWALQNWRQDCTQSIFYAWTRVFPPETHAADQPSKGTVLSWWSWLMVTRTVQPGYRNARHLPFDTLPFSVPSLWRCETSLGSRSKTRPWRRCVTVQISTSTYLKCKHFLIKQKSPDASKQLKTISKDSKSHFSSFRGTSTLLLTIIFHLPSLHLAICCNWIVALHLAHALHLTQPIPSFQ